MTQKNLHPTDTFVNREPCAHTQTGEIWLCGADCWVRSGAHSRCGVGSCDALGPARAVTEATEASSFVQAKVEELKREG
jgi:hypothetical protein